MVDSKKIRDVCHKLHNNEKVENPELEYLVENLPHNNAIWNKAKELLDRRVEYAGIIEQEKANKLSEKSNFINKWGLIISAIISIIAIIISIFAYLKP
jgi:Fe-S cluster assembly scaffold protein SufB